METEFMRNPVGPQTQRRRSDINSSQKESLKRRS